MTAMRELPPEAVNVAADAIEANPDWNLPYATAQAMARAALEAAGPVIRAQERQHVLWRLGEHGDRSTTNRGFTLAPHVWIFVEGGQSAGIPERKERAADYARRDALLSFAGDLDSIGQSVAASLAREAAAAPGALL